MGIANGTAQENYEYCSSTGKHKDKKGIVDGSFVEFGVIVHYGRSSELSQVIEEGKAGASMRELCNDHPETMVRYYNGVYKVLAMIELKKTPPKYKTTDFPSWPTQQDWKWGKSVVLWGKTGIGKTEYALSLFTNALLVTHKDQLRDYDASFHDGIVFDDMNFEGGADGKGKWPRESQIHLTDWTQDRHIHCRYGTGRIPKETRKVFTTNVDDGYIFDLSDPAISRRLEIKELIEFEFE